MAKKRAYGSDARLYLGREATYGATATSWRSMDFKSTTLSSEQPLGDDPLLGRGRDAQDPFRDLITDEGQIEVPVDLRNFGVWLTALLGDPVEENELNVGVEWDHFWESGLQAIPSYSMEVAHPQLITPAFFLHAGAVVESLSMDLGQSGPANAQLQVVAQGETKAATTASSTPDVFDLRRFSQARGGSQLAGVTASSLIYSNNLERVRTVRDDGKIEGADPTIASATGSIDLRFDGSTLVSEATDGDPVELEFGLSFADFGSVLFSFPRVFLPKPKYEIAGPGGVAATFDWRASRDPVSGYMMRVRLVNDVDTYMGA